MPDLNVCSRSIAVVAGRAMQTFRSQVSPLLHMIVEEIGIVLGADLFVGLLLYAPIAPHPGPRLVEGVRVLDREDDFHRFAVIDQSPTLHDVQLLRVRGSVNVYNGLVAQADRVDDKGVSFIVADGLAIP